MKDLPLNLIVNADADAWALAEFVKRIGWTEIRQNAKDDDEAYAMRDGIHALQKALADAGYAPR